MIALINCGSSKFPFFEGICKASASEFISLSWNDLPNQKEKNWKGVVISGAPILLTETDHSPHLRSMGCVLSWQLPVLGVCFGHQIMGLYFGATVSRCEEDRGIQKIKILSSSPLLKGMEGTVNMKEDHCECISLPEEFELTATSSICRVEAMQHRSLPLFGVQFHPEVSDEQGELLLNNFFNLCNS